MDLESQIRLVVRTWIREIQHTIKQCAESIHNAERGKKEEPYPPPDKPMEVRAVVSYDELTIRNSKADSDRSHATQESIKKATWAAFFAVAIYALVTLGMWCEMRKTTKAAQDQLSLMRDADRPWIDVDIFMTSPLTYDGKGVGRQHSPSSLSTLAIPPQKILRSIQR